MLGQLGGQRVGGSELLWLPIEAPVAGEDGMDAKGAEDHQGC